MDKNIKTEIERIVKEIFAEKEQANQRKAVTSALEKAKDKLESTKLALEAKELEIAELSAKVEDLEAKLAKASAGDVSEVEAKLEKANETVQSLETKVKELTEAKESLEADLEAKDVELSTVKEELTKVSDELAAIQAEALAKARAEELSKEGVLREGDGQAAQIEKIKAMDDETFQAYKEELVELKKVIAKQLKSSRPDPNKDTAAFNIEPDNNGSTPSPEDIGKAMCSVFGIGSSK